MQSSPQGLGTVCPFVALQLPNNLSATELGRNYRFTKDFGMQSQRQKLGNPIEGQTVLYRPGSEAHSTGDSLSTTIAS